MTTKTIQARSGLLLTLEKIYWTNTILLRTTQKFTRSQLVCCLFLNVWIILFIYLLVLHPAHKLKYFSKQDWDKEWIDTAEEIVREEFKRNNAAYVVNKGGKASCPLTKKVSYSSLIQIININFSVFFSSTRLIVMIAQLKTLLKSILALTQMMRSL